MNVLIKENCVHVLDDFYFLKIENLNLKNKKIKFFALI